MTQPTLICNTGGDLLEAEIIMQDVIQIRRRVLGPAHPITHNGEILMNEIREKLADA